DQVFQSNQTAYTASGRFSQSSVMVTPVASDTNAAIQVNGLDVTSGAASGAISLSTGSNTLTIAVTAEDGSTTQSYTVDVTRLPPASDADLAGLALSDITLDQVFQSNQTTYTASTGFLQNSLTVTPQTSDQYASIEVNGSSVESGDASDFIALAEGSNTLTVIVTAEDGTTTQTYTVDVTRANAASFAQQAYVKASNTEQQDSFGRNVALSGDTLAVAAPGERSNATGINGDESNNDQNLSGAVYVFTRSGGIWTQQAYIKSSTSLFNNQFGSSLALDQDTLVITAPGENAVYIFTRNGSDWTQQQILSDVTAGRLALEADTLVIGNPGDASNATGINGDENNSDETKSGAVYVYTRTANTWTRQAYIKASNTDQYDRFGWSVALSGDTLAVGATGEDSTATGINGDQSINATGGSREHTHRGAAYVFTRSNGSWTQQAYIKPTNTGQEYKFGFSVALSGDTLAVSQPYEDIDLLEEGAVYIYTRSGTDWSQQAYLQDNSYVILFGWSLDLSGDSLVVGANLGGTSTPEYVYYYNRNGNIWSQQDKLEASNSGEYDQFGGSLSLSGDTVAIGAQREDSNATGINGNETNNDAILSGAVYVFQ
ncbi:MAG: cadherin-like beta sandwich domain-containing protein, partial [Gammaproteobacteria bacterium]|nr:cadherin-like beta sandwich domain-containing protein [Gammaproteobacteria bacterium]